ncbi:MAG: hypothetical protein BWY83_02268 [bacterium ADurb.Bin478]|nr:MAG: hypothetical protein BWY83_02268 [bacterium ADurb.Bin478]
MFAQLVKDLCELVAGRIDRWIYYLNPAEIDVQRSCACQDLFPVAQQNRNNQFFRYTLAGGNDGPFILPLWEYDFFDRGGRFLLYLV